MKKCELASCDVEFESNSNRQKFCSLRCKRAAAKLAGGSSVTTAAKVSAPKTMIVLNEPWVKEVQDFCAKHGIVPADLIASYKAAQNPPPKSKQVQKKSNDIAPPVQNDEAVSAVPKNRQLTEPVPGTNAYFLRYGKWNPND